MIITTFFILVNRLVRQSTKVNKLALIGDKHTRIYPNSLPGSLIFGKTRDPGNEVVIYQILLKTGSLYNVIQGI